MALSSMARTVRWHRPEPCSVLWQGWSGTLPRTFQPGPRSLAVACRCVAGAEDAGSDVGVHGAAWTGAGLLLSPLGDAVCCAEHFMRLWGSVITIPSKLELFTNGLHSKIFT